MSVDQGDEDDASRSVLRFPSMLISFFFISPLFLAVLCESMILSIFSLVSLSPIRTREHSSSLSILDADSSLLSPLPFAGHALSGVIGTLLTGIFAQASVANNDAYAVIPGGSFIVSFFLFLSTSSDIEPCRPLFTGWLDGNFRQLGLQVAWVMVGLVWTFTVTLAIMFGEFRSTTRRRVSSFPPSGRAMN